MPWRVRNLRFRPAGPIPAGAATPTNEAATCAKVASQSLIFTPEKAFKDKAEPNHGVNPITKAARIHHGLASASALPIESMLREPRTDTTTITSITAMRTLFGLKRCRRRGSSCSGAVFAEDASCSRKSLSSGPRPMLLRTLGGRIVFCKAMAVAASCGAERCFCAEATARCCPTESARHVRSWAQSTWRLSRELPTSP